MFIVKYVVRLCFKIANPLSLYFNLKICQMTRVFWLSIFFIVFHTNEEITHFFKDDKARKVRKHHLLDFVGSLRHYRNDRERGRIEAREKKRKKDTV